MSMTKVKKAVILKVFNGKSTAKKLEIKHRERAKGGWQYENEVKKAEVR